MHKTNITVGRDTPEPIRSGRSRKTTCGNDRRTENPPNLFVGSVNDRFNNTYEHVFHFVLKNKYFFDLDAVKILGNNGRMKNPGDVWSINTQPLRGNHTATFPEKLIENIVLCGSPVGGNVLDPFLGSGTTLFVCDKLARRCIGFEMNEDFYNQSLERYNKVKQENVR